MDAGTVSAWVPARNWSTGKPGKTRQRILGNFDTKLIKRGEIVGPCLSGRTKRKEFGALKPRSRRALYAAGNIRATVMVTFRIGRTTSRRVLSSSFILRPAHLLHRVGGMLIS